VVTSRHEGALHGGTASAFTSLSDAPPMVLVCLNRSSATAQAVRASGTFAVNVLGEDHSALAARFARKGADKFAGVAVTPDPLGPPLLDEAIAHLVCSVESIVTSGTHLVFLAAVERAAGRSGPPLAYFRGGFARMLPLPAQQDPLDRRRSTRGTWRGRRSRWARRRRRRYRFRKPARGGRPGGSRS
jgi:4-nitrophenol 2-monooxygenase / 4-nitrocatechol 4-monooxygenase, reductase component